MTFITATEMHDMSVRRKIFLFSVLIGVVITHTGCQSKERRLLKKGPSTENARKLLKMYTDSKVDVQKIQTFVNRQKADTQRWRSTFDKAFAKHSWGRESYEIGVFCDEIKTFRESNLITEDWKKGIEACKTLERAKSNLSDVEERNQSARSEYEALESNVTEAQNDLENAKRAYGRLTDEYSKIVGFILKSVGEQAYEISLQSVMGGPSSNHAILKTRYTEFRTKGKFDLWVKRTGSKDVRLRNGTTARWPVFVEAGESKMTSARAALLKAQRRLSDAKRELREEPKPDTEFVEPYKNKVKSAEERILSILEMETVPGVDNTDESNSGGAESSSTDSEETSESNAVGSNRHTPNQDDEESPQHHQDDSKHESPKETSTSSFNVSESTSDMRTVSAWKVDHTWFYRVERRAGSVEGDEASRLDYHVKLQIVNRRRVDDTLQLTMRRTGGLEGEQTFQWTVTKDCIESSRTNSRIFCAKETPAEEHVAEVSLNSRNVRALRWREPPQTATFHPKMGLISINRSSDKGRDVHSRLVGWRLERDNGGTRPDHVSLCQWKNTVVDGTPLEYVSSSRLKRYRRRFELDSLGNEIVARTLDYSSGANVVDRATVLAGEERTLAILENENQIIASHRYETATYAIRSFVAPTTESRILHLVLAEEANIELVLLNLSETPVRGLSWRLERIVGEADYYGADVVPYLNGCRIRFLNRQPDDDRIIANFDIEDGEFVQKSGGSLSPVDSKQYTIQK
jgi:hypothetical protein